MIDLSVLYVVFIFLFGLVLGSFINVVVYRLKHGGTIARGRSRCPKCKKQLGFFDLIPIFSYLFLAGKCRYCKKKISIQYPVVELSTAIILTTLFINLDFLKNRFEVFSGFNNTILFIFLGYVILSLLVIFIYDVLYYLIPDSVLLPAIFITCLVYLIVYFLGFKFSLMSHVIGMIIFSGFFAIQYFVSKGKWVGGGDIKLGLLLGIILGWELSIVSLMLSYILGSIVALILIALGKKTRKDIIAFGPFLIASSLFVIFFGLEIIDWYFSILKV